VTTMLPRRFALARHVGDTDEVIAFGVAFTDGHVVLRWCSTHPATSAWNSLDDMLAVHGHREDTIIQWIDALPTELNDVTAVAGQGRRARRRAVRSDEEAAASAALVIPDSPANGFQRPRDATEPAVDVSVPAPGQPGRHRRAGQVEHSV
jgi:hypothetical protein